MGKVVRDSVPQAMSTAAAIGSYVVSKHAGPLHGVCEHCAVTHVRVSLKVMSESFCTVQEEAVISCTLMSQSLCLQKGKSALQSVCAWQQAEGCKARLVLKQEAGGAVCHLADFEQLATDKQVQGLGNAGRTHVGEVIKGMQQHGLQPVAP